MNIGCLVALGLTIIPSVPAPQPLPQPPQQSPAAAATARALANAVDTSFALAALPGRDADWQTVDSLQPEPLEAQLDRTLHRQIGDFVEAWLREHGADAPAERLQEELQEELWWGSTTEEPPPRHWNSDVRCPLDGNVKLAVVRPDDDPGLLAVSWKTQLSHLSNGSLHVFTIGGGRVEPVLEWSAELAGWPEGDSPGVLPLPFGATDVLSDFGFRITGRDERGDFYVAAAWSEPSPSSSWGAVSWVLLASGSHPRSPRVLARGSDGAWQCYEDECYVLALEDDVVTLDYTGSGGELAVCNGFTSSGVQRAWRLVDAGADQQSVPGPVPFSFLSDWIDAPWRDARLWSARGWAMRRWHRLLRDVACQLERGRQWVDGCEATRREVLELVLLTEARDPLFFVFDSEDTLRLVEITPIMPAGKWHPEDECYPVPDEPATEPIVDAADER
ncbi:MAG TPA: hypothetical protein VN811_04100 [Thermoanaerobaculia bacterium]|nr:hypothetical protein [Thermoanaerobaculia bacterium]